jgi:cell fate regulator YaaT (PSP1 superfamily)
MSTDPLVVARMAYNNGTCYLSIPDFEVSRGMLVLVETPNGPEIAQVSGIGHACCETPKIGKIIRVCTEEDLNKHAENLEKAQNARELTLEKIHQHNLDMKLVSIHFFFDNSKVLFNFTADGRVDFRELVKDLASVFRTRIELRQIGARDEAKIITGYGVCGREFCCDAIKHELEPVTIRMAKDQSLTLNSSKISGACGRLLCCLAYEHEAYCSVKRDFPHEGTLLQYEGRTVTLSEINILKMTATLRTEDNVNVTIPLEDLKDAKRMRRGSGTTKNGTRDSHHRGQSSKERSSMERSSGEKSSREPRSREQSPRGPNFRGSHPGGSHQREQRAKEHSSREHRSRGLDSPGGGTQRLHEGEPARSGAVPGDARAGGPDPAGPESNG